jgi:hypothetical protein
VGYQVVLVLVALLHELHREDPTDVAAAVVVDVGIDVVAAANAEGAAALKGDVDGHVAVVVVVAAAGVDGLDVVVVAAKTVRRAKGVVLEIDLESLSFHQDAAAAVARSCLGYYG